MRRPTTRRNIVIGLIISVLFIFFFAVFGFRNIRKVIRERQTMNATMQSLLAMEELMDDMQDIETGEQGYIISGDKKILEPYQAAIQRLTKDTIAIKGLYSLYPERIPLFQQLLQLVREKAAITKTTIALVDSTDRDRAKLDLQSLSGRSVMGNIQDIIIRFEEKDRDILQQSNTAREKAARATVRLFLSLAVLFIAGLIIIFWRIRRSLKEQEKSEQQIAYLAGLTEKTSDAIFSTDLQGIIRSWNKGAEDIYGHTRDEAIGKFAPEITRSGNTKKIISEMHAKVREQGSMDMEVLNHNKKGEPVYCLASVTALKDEQGEITGYVTMLRDITERKKAEQLLEKFNEELTRQVKEKTAEINHSNERFEMISRTTNDAIWEWNLETGAMWGNETHQQLYGLRRTDPVPNEEEWVKRIHPDDRESLVSKQAETLASAANIFITEYRFNTFKKGYKDIYDRCYIVRNDEGKAIRILGSMMDVTESKKAQAALQQSEEKYRTMIEQASDGIFMMDQEGRYIDVNPAGCLMLGYSVNELTGLSASEVLQAGELPMPKLKYKELQSGETIVMERKLVKKGGDRIDTEVSYKMLSNGNILAIARDITEKKRAELAIRASEETRKLIMNSALDAIVCIDTTSTITVWTPQAERIFGWTAGEALGKKLTDTIIPGKSSEQHKNGMSHYLQTGKGNVINRLTELIAINKDNKEFPIELSIIPIKQDGSEFFCAFIRDITERKEAAAKIVKEKELSETAINSLPGIFYIFDTNRKLLKWNKNFEIVSGYSAAEITQITPVGFFAEEDRLRASQKVVEIFHKGSAELEALFLTRSGEKIPYFFTGRAINYEGKSCMLGTGIDIAELRKTQQNYASLVNTVDGIVWEADVQTFQFSFVSQQAERLLGYPAEQWISDPSFWVDHIHPADRQWAVEYCISSTQKKKAHEFEYRMIAADGRVVWLRDIVSIILENDEPVQLRGIMVDITEQKKTDKEILESNARFQTISKATSDIVWDLDIRNGNIWWNDNYYLLLGIKKVKETTPINDWFNRIHPDDINRVKRDVEKGMQENKTFYSHEYRFAKADGSYLHFLDRTFVMRNQEGEPYRMIGSMVNMTPIYEAQRVVAESENRLRTIINSEPQCIKLLDKNGLMLDMNPAGLSMVEADSIEQVKGHPVLDIVDKEYRKDFSRLVNDVFNDKPGSMPFSITGLKGTKRWLETHAVPMKDAEGKITALLGVTMDITDKRKAEEELKKNEEKYRTLVEQAIDAIALYDATGKILDVNTGSVNLVGYTKKELMQMSLSDILTAEEISTKPVRYDVLRTGESTVKQRKMRKKDGSVVETEVRSQQLPDGRFLSVIRDLTEREKAQQQIEREKELSDKLIDSLPGVFYWYDEKGKFLRWNKQFETVTGYSATEIATMHPTDFFEGQGRRFIAKKIKEVFNVGISDAEADFISKDGSKHPYYFKALRITIDGKPSLLGTGIDISDRKKAEQELDESYKDIRKLTGHLQNIREQERTHIAREIHDELGQQLTVLKMDVSWLNKKIGHTDDGIRQKMKSLLAMLDETVKSVRRISSELRPSLLDDLGLTAAMEWQLTEFEKRSGIHTRFVNSGEEIALQESIKTALFRIFQESLTNVARHSTAGNIDVRFVEENESLVLSIADDGKGFDKQEVADKRTLGILGMRERTSMIGGTYEIVSAPGKGTTVTVRIPIGKNINQPTR